MSAPGIEEVVIFARALREHGLAVTLSEVVAAVKTLRLIDSSDRDETFLSFRSIFTTRVEDFPVFEELFAAFWSQSTKKPVAREIHSNAAARVRVSSPTHTTKGLAYFLEHWTSPRAGQPEKPIRLPGASDSESDAEKDFSLFGTEELDEVARLARRIVRRLARNPSRRWKPVKNGPRAHLRRTIRQSLKTGGEMIELSFKQRKPKRTKLVIVCDISGSMDLYSRLLLQFVYGLQNSFARVETFVFSTSLVRITWHLRNRTYQRALARLSAQVRGWSGGTLIGASIAALNSEWPRLIDKRTIVVILSDGWDTGEPELLARQVAILKKHAARLIWLNPLLGNPGYQPMTRGMQAALPFINVFAPAHDLASLRALEPHLIL
jgi:uncharacterized protein with von Willebrand factor type A (vWA) domain